MSLNSLAEYAGRNALPLAIASQLAACGNTKIIIGSDEGSATPTCEYAGVNTDVDADLAEGATDSELLETYGANFAVRLQVTLTDEGYYVGGTIEDADGNTAPYYCMSNAGGNCQADVYTACEDQVPTWNVEFNAPVQAVGCGWVLEGDAETPDHEPSCELDEEGTALSIDAE